MNKYESLKSKIKNVLNKYEHVIASEESALNMYVEIKEIYESEDKQ